MVERARLSKKQDPFGAISQMFAALAHKVSPQRMSKISESIPKITITCGDEDYLVDTSCSVDLKNHLPKYVSLFFIYTNFFINLYSSEFVIFKNTGHGLISQRPFKFNRLIEKTVNDGRKLCGPLPRN